MSNLLKKVDAELEIAKELNPVMAMGMLVIRKMIVEVEKDSISLGRLNGLTPTLQSCTMKIFEEIGEVMRLLSKGQSMSGEYWVKSLQEIGRKQWVLDVIGEALDGIQSLSTLIYVLVDENDINIQDEIGRHEAKLVAKGYLSK